MTKTLKIAIGIAVLVLAACGPAAQPTATVAPATATSAPRPTATVAQRVTPAPATATAVPTQAPSATGTGVGKPQYGGIFTTQLRGDPFGWDPQRLTGGFLDGLKVGSMVFEPLAGYPAPLDIPDCALAPKPLALEKWDWTNDTTLDLKLRQGMRFQNKPPVNGREVTSDDAVFSLNRALQYKPQGVGPIALRVVDVKALDRYTVRMAFDQPTPMAIERLIVSIYAPFVMPKEAAIDGKYDDPAKTAIGSSAFMFKEYRPGVKVSYIKNPDYWNKGLPYVDGVDMLIIPDQSTRMALFQAGKLDLWLGEVPATFVAPLRKAPQGKLFLCSPTTQDGFIAPRNDLPPFNDVRVRRAVSMALDRKVLLDTVLGGLGTETIYAPAGIYPWAQRIQDLPPETRKYVEHHPDEAKKLLAEAGFPNGLKTTLDGSPQYGSPHVPYLEAMQAMFAEAGISAAIKWWEYTAFQNGPNMGKHEGLALVRYSYIDLYQAVNWLYPKYEENPNNKAHVDDPVLSKLAEQIYAAVDPAKRDDLMRQFVTRMADQAVVIPLPALNEVTVVQRSVGGFHMAGQRTPAGPLLTPLWIEKR